MNEDAWLASTDPDQMLHFLGDGASARKLRLFALACCRRIWHLLTEKCRTAVEVAEAHFDGGVSKEQLATARKGIRDSFASLIRAPGRGAQVTATYVVLSAVSTSISRSPASIANVVARGARQAVESVITLAPGALAYDSADFQASIDALVRAEAVKQSDLLRELFGNPFRPIALDPQWSAWENQTIVKIAQRIVDERAFANLPVIADALEEAGCTNADLLAHCRAAGSHFRGCWAIDSLLGKA